MALDVVKSDQVGHARPVRRRRTQAAGVHEAVLAGLPRLAVALGARPSLQTIAELAADALRPLDAAGAAILAVDDEGRMLDIATTGVSDAMLTGLGPTVPGNASPVLAALARQQALWLGNRARVAHAFPTFAALDMPWQAYAAAPLLLDGTLTGSIAIPFATERGFSAVERTCIRSVFALLAQAVEEFRHGAEPVEDQSPHLRPLLELVGDPILVVNVVTDRLVYANPALVELVGLDAGAITAMTRDQFAERLAVQWLDRERRPAPKVIRADASGFMHCSVRTADGSERLFEVHHSAVDANGYRMTVLIDVTERLATAKHDHLLREAVWEERDRLARDLHDGVVQSVFATSLTLAAASLRAPDSLRVHIEDAIDGLDGVVQQLRSTVFALARPRSSGGDASDLLRSIAAKATRSLGFEPTVAVIGDAALVTDSETLGHLVLAAREALSNVARHAKASAVAITLDVGAASVDLVVADNGIGFHPDRGPGDGLDNLRRRAEDCGGTCVISSTPDSGTTVRWSVPYT